jgi:hypothetical protein
MAGSITVFIAVFFCLLSLLQHILFRKVQAIAFYALNCSLLLPSGASDTPKVHRASLVSILVMFLCSCVWGSMMDIFPGACVIV